MYKTTIRRVSITLFICIMAGYALAPVMAEKVTTVVSGDSGIGDPDLSTYDISQDISGNVIVTINDEKNRIISTGNKEVTYVITDDGKKRVISVDEGRFSTANGGVHHGNAEIYGDEIKSIAVSAKMGKYAIARDANDDNPDNFVIVGDDGIAQVSG